jgi:SAM-dependent methyltransferase
MPSATGTYVFDQRRDDEHERIAGMEELWDEGTKALLGSLGIAPGWRCLEVGAGGGSIAAWLADMVAPTGAVLATDINTHHLDTLERPNLKVRRHDVLSDPLPDGRFDLVHARLVVEHIGGRAVDRIVTPLRPGGWLVVEDFDWQAMCTHPHEYARRTRAGSHRRDDRRDVRLGL